MPPAATVVAAVLPPHADPLNPAKFAKSITAYDSGEDERKSADTDEAKIGFFDKVLEIHAVETGDKGTRANSECADAEFQIEQHQRVSIGVQDRFDSICCQQICHHKGEGSESHFFRIADVADKVTAHLNNLIAHLVI